MRYGCLYFKYFVNFIILCNDSLFILFFFCKLRSFLFRETVKNIILLSVLITIINYANLLSNEEIIAKYSNNITDSTLAASDSAKIQVKDSLHIHQSEFMYADNPQYTFNGELPLRETSLRPLNASIVAGIYAGAFIIQHQIQMNTIWKEQTAFKFEEDGDYAFYVDKAGHFYGTWVMSHFLRETFLWSGFNYKTSYWLGAMTGLAYSTYVEILDGYGKNWGFSPSDFYCDVLGTAFSIGQLYVPFLQNFTPKFHYIPSPWFGERTRTPSEIMIDDYSSQVFWLSVNVHNLLSDNLKKYWPSWLQLSFGYTARNLCNIDSPEGNAHHYDQTGRWTKGDPKFIVALDYDLVKLLPGDGKFWGWLKQSLNVLKLPSPAIEFSKNRTNFYLLYPFKF